MIVPSTASDEPQALRKQTGPKAVIVATSRAELAGQLCQRLSQESYLAVRSILSRNADHIIVELQASNPDVLMVDESALDALGPRAMPLLHSKFPELRVLLLCDRPGTVLVTELIRNRFCGFLRFGKALEDCVRAVRTICRGGLWVPRALMERAIFELAQWPERGSPATGAATELTCREAQTVEYLRRGMTNKQIAAQLGITEDTVKKHLQKVYAKLGIHRRTELLALHVL